MGFRSEFLFVCIILLCASCLLTKEEPTFKIVSSTPVAGSSGFQYRVPGTSGYLAIKDSIWVNDQGDFVLTQPRLLEFQVEIDNTVVIPFTASSGGNFRINFTPQPRKGILTLKTRLKAETGSLADRLGAEYVEYKEDFVLIVGDRSYVPKLTAAIVDGILRISWNRYPHQDFYSYQLNRVSNAGSKTFELKARSRNGFNDSTYVGGDATYKLSVITGATQIASDGILYKDTYKPRLAIESTGPLTIRFLWPNAPFNRAVVKYEVTKSSVSFGSSTTSPLDVNANVPFGEVSDYYLTLSSVDNSVYYKTTNLGLGTPIPELRDVVYNPSKHAYYGFRPQKLLPPADPTNVLYKLSDDFKVLDSVVSPLQAFYNVGYVLKSADHQQHYIITPTKLQKFDPGTLGAIGTTSFASLGLAGAEFSFEGPGTDYNDGRGSFVVTNNNLLLCQTYASNKQNVYIIDLATHTVLFTTQYVPLQPQTVRAMHLSSDGQYFVLGLDLYKFNGSSYVLTATLPYNSAPIVYEQFFDSDPSQLLIATDTKLFTYDCATLSEATSVNLIHATTSTPRLDQITNKLIVTDVNNTKYLIDLSGPSSRYVNATGDVWLTAGYLFTSLGYVTSNY